MNFAPSSQSAPLVASLLEQLRQSPVAVLGHVRPDGDCIGSQVALTRVLRSLGVEAVAVNAHPVPSFCEAFVSDTPFFLEENWTMPEGCVFLSVDCAGRKRFGEKFASSGHPVFLAIDHHISNESYAEHTIVHPQASSTGEVLTEIFLENKWPIDAITAQALYVGIATDTGQFRYEATNERVFAICAELVRHGARPNTAALALYANEPVAKLKLLGRFLDSLRFYCEGRLCIGTIRQSDWEATGASPEDTEGLVDYARDVAGVEIGVLLEERGDSIKGSLRAKNPVHRVDLLAKAFNGGGHAAAAGFNPEKPFDETYPRLLETLTGHFQNLQARA
jgi:bifunctional oligoribonuclease and PAP phosphatase NrnA